MRSVLKCMFCLDRRAVAMFCLFRFASTKQSQEALVGRGSCLVLLPCAADHVPNSEGESEPCDDEEIQANARGLHSRELTNQKTTAHKGCIQVCVCARVFV